MKLFLSSTHIPKALVPSFTKFVGKDLKNISFALIENAADPYSTETDFVLETRSSLQSLGMHLEIVDLSTYKNKPDELREKLENFDVIWFGGGNTYYLRWLMKETGFDKIVRTLLDKNIVYGGGSAGAIVAQTTLKQYDLVDSTNVSPEVIYSGLCLTNLIIVPHWGTDSIQKELNEISNFHTDSKKVITISDEQAVIINNENWRILP